MKKVDALLKEGHLDLVEMKSAQRARYADLIMNLGRGEASCIALASAGARRRILVTDDRAARGRCAESKIRVTGTIRILKAACLDKQVSAVEADRVLKRMIDEGFFCPVGRISDLL